MDARRAKRGMLKSVFRNRFLLAAGLGVSLAAVLITQSQPGFGQPEKKSAKAAPVTKNPGLRGILPMESPDDLVLEEFDPLGKEWAKWSEGVSNDLMKLYGEDIDAAGQRKVIASLREKLKTAAAGTGSPAVVERLDSLHGRIRRRIDVAEAVLDTLDADPDTARKAQLKAAWDEVGSALDALESHLRGYQNGLAWMGYLKAKDIRAAKSAGNAKAPAITAAATKIKNRGGLKSKEQSEFLGQDAFLRVESALTKLNAVATAPPKTVDMPKLRAALKDFVTAVEQYEAKSLVGAAGAVRKAYDTISGLSADSGAAIGAALRSHYYNYNFRVYISEDYINKLIAERRVERGTVNDQVMEARVYGNQVTSTRVGVNLRPSNRDARMDITLSGVTQSSTVGVTSQASIYTSGYHRFWAAKEVRFDGDTFTTSSHARISVSANNTTTGATTKYSKLLLFGPIADNIAINEANKRRSQSEAIARQKIQEKVLPRFNGEIRDQFAKANKDMKDKFLKKLADAGLKPDAVIARTSEDYLLYSSRVMNPGELGGDMSNSREVPGNGVTLKIHESAMNNAFNRLKIAGRTLTEEELIAEIEKSLMNVLGSDYSQNKPKPEPKKKKAGDQDKFVFDKTDPIRFRVRNGMLNIVIRAGLKPAGKEEIPTQVVTVPLKLTIVGDDLVMKRGDVIVAPAAPPESRTKQIVRAGIMRTKIEDSITDRKRSRKIVVEREEGQKPLNATINNIRTVNGWVTVWAK